MFKPIYLRINPEDINFVNKIMEGYEYLGMVSTLDRSEGLLIIRVTPDTYADARMILSRLPVKHEFLEPDALERKV